MTKTDDKSNCPLPRRKGSKSDTQAMDRDQRPRPDADRRIFKLLMALDAQALEMDTTEPPALGCFDALMMAAA